MIYKIMSDICEYFIYFCWFLLGLLLSYETKKASEK
jgi:hypothetical protein